MWEFTLTIVIAFSSGFVLGRLGQPVTININKGDHLAEPESYNPSISDHLPPEVREYYGIPNKEG